MFGGVGFCGREEVEECRDLLEVIGFVGLSQFDEYGGRGVFEGGGNDFGITQFCGGAKPLFQQLGFRRRQCTEGFGLVAS